MTQSTSAKCDDHDLHLVHDGNGNYHCPACRAATPDQPDANPKKAYGDKKVALHLVPPVLEIYAALKLKEGEIKYGFYNYREIPVEMMTYIGAIKRHLAAILDGEWMDPAYWQEVDGVNTYFPATPHLAGLIASAAIMADSYERGTLIDNRPAPGNASELLTKYMSEDSPEDH